MAYNIEKFDKKSDTFLIKNLVSGKESVVFRSGLNRMIAMDNGIMKKARLPNVKRFLEIS